MSSRNVFAGGYVHDIEMLREGDEIGVAYNGKIAEITGTRIMMENGLTFRFGHPSTSVKPDIRMLTPVKEVPENWPPQNGDVWATNYNHFMVHRDTAGVVRAHELATGVSNSIDSIKHFENIHLVSRIAVKRPATPTISCR